MFLNNLIFRNKHGQYLRSAEIIYPTFLLYEKYLECIQLYQELNLYALIVYEVEYEMQKPIWNF